MALLLYPLLPSINDNHWCRYFKRSRRFESSSPVPALLFLAHGEVGGGRQRRTPLTEAPDRRRRRGRLGTGEAACRFSRRIRFEHTRHSSSPRCSPPSILDAPGFLTVRRGWLAGRQRTMTKQCDECRQITWAGLGCHSQIRPVFEGDRESRGDHSCQRNHGSQRTGGYGAGVQHAPGMQQRMGEGPAQGGTACGTHSPSSRSSMSERWWWTKAWHRSQRPTWTQSDRASRRHGSEVVVPNETWHALNKWVLRFCLILCSVPGVAASARNNCLWRGCTTVGPVPSQYGVQGWAAVESCCFPRITQWIPCGTVLRIVKK